LWWSHQHSTDEYGVLLVMARYNVFRQRGVIHTYRQRAERLSFLSPTTPQTG
jgi:hypothetical protein